MTSFWRTISSVISSNGILSFSNSLELSTDRRYEGRKRVKKGLKDIFVTGIRLINNVNRNNSISNADRKKT